MVDVKASAMRKAIHHLQQALSLCDDDGIGLAAAPYIDLAINLLQSEESENRAASPDRG